MYECILCGRKFKHKYDLNVHEKGKHGINVKNDNAEKSNLLTNPTYEMEKENPKTGNTDRKSFTSILGAKN